MREEIIELIAELRWDKSQAMMRSQSDEYREGYSEAMSRAIRKLERVIEDSAILVKPQPKSSGRVGCIEI